MDDLSLMDIHKMVTILAVSLNISSYYYLRDVNTAKDIT